MTDADRSTLASGRAVHDEALALAAAGGDAALAGELLAALCAGLPSDLAELRAHWAAAAWQDLAEAAHRLRGATRYCGVSALDEDLANLERRTRAGREPAAIGEALQWVEQAAQRLLQGPCRRC